MQTAEDIHQEWREGVWVPQCSYTRQKIQCTLILCVNLNCIENDLQKQTVQKRAHVNVGMIISLITSNYNFVLICLKL